MLKSLEEIKKLVKSKSQKVNRGLDYESKLRLFTQPKEKEALESENSFDSFLGSMRSKIADKEKRKEVEKFINYPLTSVNITTSILQELYKVFEASNSLIDVSIIENKEREQKFISMLGDMDIRNYILKEGKKVLKNQPNKIVVVDRNEKGLPYLVTVDNVRLKDVFILEDGVTIEAICFSHSFEIQGEDKIEKVAYYDTEKYYVLSLKDGEVISTEEKAHNLGFCPACFFVDSPLYDGEYSRQIPLSSVLSKLAEWQEFDVYRYFTDHTAPFPFVVLSSEDCTQEGCENGTIYYEEERGGNIIDLEKECPSCLPPSLALGSVIEVMPNQEGEYPKDNFRIVSASSENLKYLNDKLTSIEDLIKKSVVGVDKVESREAMNKEQVGSLYESRTNVLLSIKTNFDRVHKFIVKTAYLLSFKNDTGLSVFVDYGTEWYLITEDELQERFNKAKESGLPITEIDNIYNQLVTTKYKNNPNKAKRIKLINSFDPLRYNTLEEKIQKLNLSLVTKEDLILSENLISLVEAFERKEGIKIEEFGVSIKTPTDKAKNHENILQNLKSFINEPSGTSGNSNGDRSE